jgi:hypothetical protein
MFFLQGRVGCAGSDQPSPGLTIIFSLRMYFFELSLFVYVYIYIPACYHTYIHTYTHTYIHTYIHIYTYNLSKDALFKAVALKPNPPESV